MPGIHIKIRKPKKLKKERKKVGQGIAEEWQKY